MRAYLATSFSPEKQAAELADAASVFLIAEVNGAAVGYARLREGHPAVGLIGSRPIDIVRFYARQEWVRQGVGATLMRACLDEAVQRGCDTIWLDVWERNHRACGFYLKWGFMTASGKQG
jgi:GNAT superfamily N-acetyltransferase